ncbi:MAG TPA: glycosyltransferase family 2 protein [Candidatus Acidoferrum sp.]|nr:glycosyltransferase family 2 protein [Candidatus Acidoferrum sp.]
MSAAAPQAEGLRLSVSLVCYRSDHTLLRRTLDSLSMALQKPESMQFTTRLTVIDNGQQAQSLRQLLDDDGWSQATLIANADNVGFGKANNQAIRSAVSDFHLVLNPDVELASDALQTGLDYLLQHPNVAAVSPACCNASGDEESLCKRYPSLRVLLLRGFAPRWLKQMFNTLLARYECKDLLAKGKPTAMELISGCFMLCRTAALQRVGGFDERYFLYFEDFALSRALATQGELHHVPACKITHHGGHAARKGLRHILMFARSAARFYDQFGWKLW